MKDVPCRQDGKGRSHRALSENVKLKWKFVLSNNREETETGKQYGRILHCKMCLSQDAFIGTKIRD